MRRTPTRPAVPVVLATLATLGAVGARPTARAEEPAAPFTVTVATEVVPAPKPGDPPPGPGGPVRVQLPPFQVELEPGAAAGAQVAEGAGAWKGQLELGDAKLPVSLVLGPDDTATLAVDGDGDGAFDATKESSPVRLAAMGPTGLRTATLPAFPLRAAALSTTVTHRTATFGGMISALGRPTPGKPLPSAALVFADGPPAGAKNVPALEGTVRSASGTVGTTKLWVVAARGAGDALTVLVSDGEDFATAARPPLVAQPLKRSARTIGVRWGPAPVKVGEATFQLALSDTVDTAMIGFAAPGSRRGAATVDGAEHVLFLLDGDFDGRFTGSADAWWFGPEEAWRRNPKRPRIPNPTNMYEGDAPQLLEGGVVWRLSGVDEAGKATLVRTTDAAAAAASLHRRAERVNARRWFPRFAEDKEFVAQRMPEARPRATTPAPFRFALTLDEAKALAAAEGKPLLVDFEADWCSWCKRLDYHTYPDAEVVAKLARFTCVKLNNELDPKQSFQTTGWSGIPAVGVMGADGKLVVFQPPARDGKTPPPADHIAGFLPPKEFAATLDAIGQALDDLKAGKPPLALPARQTPRMPEPPAPPMGEAPPPPPGDAPKPPSAPAPTPAPEGAPTPPAPDPAPTK